MKWYHFAQKFISTKDYFPLGNLKAFMISIFNAVNMQNLPLCVTLWSFLGQFSNSSNSNQTVRQLVILEWIFFKAGYKVHEDEKGPNGREIIQMTNGIVIGVHTTMLQITEWPSSTCLSLPLNPK